MCCAILTENRELRTGEAMKISVLPDKKACGQAAAEKAAELLRKAIADEGRTSFIQATGASQFDHLEHLTVAPDIQWDKTAMFHLDEYIGLPLSHPASFRAYLKKRLIDKVKPGEVFLVDGETANAAAECARLNDIIREHDIAAAFIGIGENGHLAFNDPPADFKTEEPFIVVELDEACREQQIGEGWFKTLEEVPRKAISMSVKQIMKSRAIVCTVPDERKAQAVKDCLEGEVSPEHPASILQQHPCCFIFLDNGSASLLSK